VHLPRLQVDRWIDDSKLNLLDSPSSQQPYRQACEKVPRCKSLVSDFLSSKVATQPDFGACCLSPFLPSELPSELRSSWRAVYFDERRTRSSTARCVRCFDPVLSESHELITPPVTVDSHPSREGDRGPGAGVYRSGARDLFGD
jgi:hypothetical protein